MSDDQDRPRLLGLAAQIVSAHVSKNVVSMQELSPLIESVYQALKNAGGEAQPAPSRPEPATPIKRSVFADYLVCLEDGKKLKMLKRHLKTAYSMTPDEYRARWGLPPDYPMVAPSYAKHRSSLAKQIGLGIKKAASEPEAGPPPLAKSRAPRSAVRKTPPFRRRRRAAAS